MNGFRVARDDGVAVVWLDIPGERVNKLTLEMLTAFGELLDGLEHDPDVQTAVLISRKEDSFIVGADIAEFATFRTPEEAYATVRKGQALFNRLESFRKPVVAAVHGAAAGGGVELMLACHYRLATEHPKTKFSLPEVNLGLLPGLGGTQRLPRLVGVQGALEMVLTGRSVYPKSAHKSGLIDALIHPPGLLQAAKRAARELVAGTRGAHRRGSWRDRLLERTPLNRLVYRQAEMSIDARTGGHYPAPKRILGCIRIGQTAGFEAGLEAEARGFSELLFSPQSRALIHLFFAKNASEKNPFEEAAHEVGTVGVLGAGLMGTGIAQVSATGGYDVLLKDRDLKLAAKGKEGIWKGVSERVGKGRSAFERDQIVERVVPVANYAPFRAADVVIEAVLEDASVKRSVLAEVERVTGERMVFATNTSSIPLSELAEGAKRPKKIVGMHYFSPAQRMPLLEIVKTDHTPDWVLGTAYAVGLAQGKTIITVRDSPGFYTTRILALFINEALLLIGEGAAVEEVDGAMRAFGFPVGPLTLLDEVGLDVGAHITEVLRPLMKKRGLSLSEAGAALVGAGYKGRKNGRGFYRYDGVGDKNGDRNKEVNSEVYRFFGDAERISKPPQETQDRLVFAMINEAVRCLEEGVLASPRDGDVGAVFGVGFPPFLGGPFWYVDERGLEDTVTALERLENAHGPRFEPARLLRAHLREGRTFFD